MLETIGNALLGSQAVQGAVAVLAVSLVGWLIQRWQHTRHVVSLAILAYKYAEREGLIEGMVGYEKLAVFMENFVERYREIHEGQEPKPAAKAAAVRAAELEVRKEDHLGK